MEDYIRGWGNGRGRGFAVFVVGLGGGGVEMWDEEIERLSGWLDHRLGVILVDFSGIGV
jgi:hypothetical protein